MPTPDSKVQGQMRNRDWYRLWNWITMDWNFGSATKKMCDLAQTDQLFYVPISYGSKKKKGKRLIVPSQDDNLRKQFAILVTMHYIIISIFLICYLTLMWVTGIHDISGQMEAQRCHVIAWLPMASFE